jgi:hypothetical protein
MAGETNPPRKGPDQAFASGARAGGAARRANDHVRSSAASAGTCRGTGSGAARVTGGKAKATSGPQRSAGARMRSREAVFSEAPSTAAHTSVAQASAQSPSPWQELASRPDASRSQCAVAGSQSATSSRATRWRLWRTRGSKFRRRRKATLIPDPAAWGCGQATRIGSRGRASGTVPCAAQGGRWHVLRFTNRSTTPKPCQRVGGGLKRSPSRAIGHPAPDCAAGGRRAGGLGGPRLDPRRVTRKTRQLWFHRLPSVPMGDL